MTEQVPVDAGEVFLASNNSQLGKARKWTWISGAIALVFFALISSKSFGSMMIGMGVTIALFATIDAYLRHKLRAGKIAAVVTREGIESPVFSGDQKHFMWSEIESAKVEVLQGVPRLELKLAEKPGLADRRNFWNGKNLSRPFITLNFLSPDDQQRMISAVNKCLQNRESGSVQGVIANALEEERQFQEQLKSFAPVTWMLWLIVGANILVWLTTVMYGGSIMQNPVDKLFYWGGNAASEVQRGDWWRLISATFLHGGLMHLAMNMIGLISAGVTVERIYGHRLFLLIYLGSGLIGSALSLHFSAQSAVSVGASGAVFGVTGALLVAVFQHRDKLPKTFGKQTISSLSIFIIYALMQGFTHQGIDNAAHVGGLIGGCALAFLLPERFDMASFIRQFKERTLASLVLIAIATIGIASTAPRAAVDQKRLFASQADFTRALANFDVAIKAIQQESEAVKNGRITERQSDERSRSIHAPAFRKVLENISAVYLRPGDPREPMLREIKRMTELFAESLAMESIYLDGSDKPTPADPQRMAAIEMELKQVDARIGKLIEESKRKK